MHIFGKILIWLTIPAAIAAIFFMSQMVHVRNIYTKPLKSLEASNEANDKRLVGLRKEVLDEENELNLLTVAWNQYWDEIAVGAVPADNNSVNTQLTRNQALVAEGAELPQLQAFENEGAGTRYVGPFQATKMDNQSSVFKPTWKPRPGDAERWSKPGVKWRWRGTIPSSNVDQFVEIQDRLIRADQILDDRNKNLEIQTALLAAAQDRLKGHLAQLGADPEQPQAAGLVDAVANEEEGRNAAWNELDRLRRALSDENKRRIQLAAQNRQLMQKLPQPAKSEPPKKAGVAITEPRTN